MNQPTPGMTEPVPLRSIPAAGWRAPAWLAKAAEAGPVLVVEDDPWARKFIRTTIQKAGFRVQEAASGEEALALFDRERPHAVLLDIMLPGMDGFEVCQWMRQRCEEVAILMLTGRDADADKVCGLQLGADDYLVKPFSPEVLVASLHAVLRRCLRPAQAADVLTLGDLRLEFLTTKVYKGRQEVSLTPREFSLLATFLRHPGEVLTRERLHQEVWGENHFGSAKALDVFVCKLREKLEDDPAHPRHFKTEWGVGFVCV